MLFWVVLIVNLVGICIGGTPEYNVKAVVLFYKDFEGRFLLSTGALPEDTARVIRKDIQELLNEELPIEVVSLFTNLSDIPLDTDLMKNITQTFAKIHVASITNETSKKIIHEMRKHDYLGIDTGHRRVRGNYLDNNGTVAEKDIDEPVKGYKGQKLSAKQVEMKKKGMLHSPDDYVPNDVFYTIEFSCVNWETSCRLKPDFYMLASNFQPRPERDGAFPILA